MKNRAAGREYLENAKLFGSRSGHCPLCIQMEINRHNTIKMNACAAVLEGLE